VKSLIMPAMLLMNRLKYPIKFSLIFAIILIPLVVLSAILISGINDDISFLKKERQGLSYLTALRQPVEQLQQHRGMTAAYLNGASQYKDRIMSKRQEVDRFMAALTAIDNELGDVLSTRGKVAALQGQWGNIKANSMSQTPAVAIKAHSDLIEELLSLMVYVADSSGITLDAELDSYYLGDALVRGLPNMVENMGQTRALGSVVAARGSLDEKSLVRLSVLAGDIDTHFNSVRAALADVYGHNAGVSAVLKASSDVNNAAVEEMRRLVTEKLLDADPITISGDAVFETATNAISGSYKLYDAIVPVLDDLFAERILAGSNTRLMALGMVLVVILIVAYLFAGLYVAVRRSIQQIGDATGQLADGDLTARLDMDTRDEMQEIARHFNGMVEKFGAVIQQISGATGQLAAASEEVSSVAKDSASSIQRQQQETDSVATAINEMSATVHEVANNASSAASAASQADEEAKEGKAVVESAASAMGSLAQEIENAATVIQELENDSEAIGAVLDVIKNIAEQTNLLALNAAIEAARAGEHGRGFAVVADEVRTLASRTQESTAEIEAMIAKLQGGARNAVKVMQHSREQTHSGVDQAQSAANALQAITHAVGTITEMNTQIASAAEEQSAVTEEINRNVASITDVSVQTSAGAEQTTSSANELARLAAELQVIVGQFRV